MAVWTTGFIGTSKSEVLFFSTNVEQLLMAGDIPHDSHPAYIGKLERGKATSSLWLAAKGRRPSLQAAITVQGGTFRSSQMAVVLSKCQLVERQTQTELTLETFCTEKRYGHTSPQIATSPQIRTFVVLPRYCATLYLNLRVCACLLTGCC